MGTLDGEEVPESCRGAAQRNARAAGEDRQPAERDGGCQPQAQDWCEESLVWCKKRVHTMGEGLLWK